MFNVNILFIFILKSKYYVILIVINFLDIFYVIVIVLKCDFESYY